jgi:4-hydroxy-2-oxoglutarate aldolase
MPELEGIFVPVPTPLRGTEIAYDRLRENLSRWNQTSLKGYVLLGSTGEFPMVSEEERDRLLVTARDAIPSGRLLLAGTGADSTHATIRLTKRAAQIGADAAIVITPMYFTAAFSQPAAQIHHYTAVADASPIPVLLYHFPQNTGIRLEPETVARVAEHPNICGIKESSGSIPSISQMIHLTPKSFHVLVGSASALLPAMTIGASGGVLAMAAIAAREYCEIYELARQRRYDEAKEIASRLMVADVGVHGRHGIGGLKAALDLQGWYGGPVRSPLVTPDGDAIEDIKEVLITAGLL